MIEEGDLELLETREEMTFEDLKNNTQISNRDLGLGISQVLPILISSNAHKNTTIAIEQPELHLHPAVQCEIADEFIRSYKKNHNEFLIETHSEHLLLRIMKRMRHTAEGKIEKDNVLSLTPDDVCLLYVDTDGTNTFINELELDEDGTLLDPWPNGFFEEGHRERFD
jgi:predicted ATPase